MKDDFALAYKVDVKKDGLYIRDNFIYSDTALLFPEDLSFMILLTDYYDIIGGTKEFVEEIVGDDIVKTIISVAKYESYLLISYEYIINKYKRLILDKYT